VRFKLFSVFTKLTKKISVKVDETATAILNGARGKRIIKKDLDQWLSNFLSLGPCHFTASKSAAGPFVLPQLFFVY